MMRCLHVKNYLPFLFLFSSILSFGKITNPVNERSLVHKGNFCLSAGYGFPSTIRFFLKDISRHNDSWVKGQGPFLVKAEYMLFKRWGIGLNASYNKTQLAWMDAGYDPAIHANRPYEYGIIGTEFSVALRGNYHFKAIGHLDTYVGAGIGYGRPHLKTYTLAPYNQFSTSFDFPKPYRVELTAGGRYYFNQYIGVYTELGLGNMWILFNRFIPEAIIQGGFCIKF